MSKSPTKKEYTGDQPTSMMIPRPIHKKLKEEAAKQDLNVSQLLRRIIQMWFDFQQKNKGDLDPEGK
jgi:hypothetical protein